MSMNKALSLSTSNYSQGRIGTDEVVLRLQMISGGSHYDVDAELVVPQYYWNKLLHFISCETCHGL